MYEEGDVILDFFGRDLGFVEICVCFFYIFFMASVLFMLTDKRIIPNFDFVKITLIIR